MVFIDYILGTVFYSMDFDEEKDFKKFQKRSYLLKKNVLTIDQKSKLELLFSKYIKYSILGKNDKRIWVDISKNCKKHQLSDLIKEIYYLLDLKKVSKQLLGKNVSCDVAMLNEVNSRFLNSEGSGGGWHRDDYHVGLKVIIYLSKANEENGCLQIIRGTHKLTSLIYQFFITIGLSVLKLKPIFIIGRSPSYRSKELNKIIDKVFKKLIFSFVGKSGDLLFFNTRALHRGKPPERSEVNNRKALTFYFETENVKGFTLKKRKESKVLLNI